MVIIGGVSVFKSVYETNDKCVIKTLHGVGIRMVPLDFPHIYILAEGDLRYEEFQACVLVGIDRSHAGFRAGSDDAPAHRSGGQYAHPGLYGGQRTDRGAAVCR